MTDVRLDILAGIETRLQRLINHPARELIAIGLLVIGVVAYAITALMLTRGVVATGDEVAWFAAADGFNPSSFFESHNGHLLAVTKFIYAADLELFGVRHLPVRVAVVVSVAATGVVVFLLLRRRLGGLVAVWPVLLVLFCGATPVPLQPFVMSFAQACAFGLAAYLVLERGGRWCDPVACVLLVFSVLSMEPGVAFAFGALVWLLLDGRRGLSRAWVAIIPLAGYGVWYVLAPRDTGPESDIFNIVLLPAYAADAAAAGAAALSGLAVDFVDATGDLAVMDISWGRIVLVGIVALIVVRARRDGLSKLQLAVIGALIALWAGGAITFGPLRYPSSERYAFTVVVALVLLLGEAYRGARLTPRGLLLVMLLTAAALGPNIYLLGERGEAVRGSAETIRTRMAVLEVAGSNVDPEFNGGLKLPVDAGDYLAATSRYGAGFGGGVAWLNDVEPDLKATADEFFTSALGLHLEPSDSTRGPGCTTASGALAEGVVLPPGGAVLESDQPTEVRVGRYDPDLSETIGSMPGGEARALVIPTDSSSVPWQVALPGASRVEICPVAPAAPGT